jgi:hypothetical protein
MVRLEQSDIHIQSPCHDCTYHTLKDKDPSPSAEPMLAIQLHQAKGKDTRQRGGHAANQVEDGEPFLNVIYNPVRCGKTLYSHRLDKNLHRVYQQDSR